MGKLATSLSVFSRKELSLIEEEQYVKELIVKIVDTLMFSYKTNDYEGSNFELVTLLRHWAKTKDEEFPIELQGLRKVVRIFKLLSKIKNPARRKEALYLATTTALSIPLSPLTGEDNEWEIMSRGWANVKYSNKRFGNVFKNEDGTTWGIGSVSRLVPNKDYTKWIVVNEENFSTIIKRFPFDIEELIIFDYYTDKNETTLISKDINPSIWLQLKRKQRNGYSKSIVY